MWGCPDLGFMAMPGPRPLGADIAGKGGHVFDQCPGYWRRTPGQWGPLPHAVDSQRVAGVVAYDLRYALDKGTVDLLTLPAKARDAVVFLLGLEADKQRAEIARMRRETEDKHRLRVVR